MEVVVLSMKPKPDSRSNGRGIFPWRWRLWTQVLVAASVVSAAHAQSPKQLWALQEPDEIVKYDVTILDAST